MSTQDGSKPSEVTGVWLEEAASLPGIDPEVDKYDLKPASHAGWLSGLSFNDLLRLRRAVRRVHLHYMPDSMYDVREADRIIETLGPVVAERLLKRAVDAKL